jgi:hypothetical protein
MTRSGRMRQRMNMRFFRDRQRRMPRRNAFVTASDFE